MTENKISVTQYMENGNLLEISYVPYDQKVEIVEAIIPSIVRYGIDVQRIDTALLQRVSCEIFIESITNIDMTLPDQHGLSGYDTLCLNNVLDDLLYEISAEYDRFMEILSYKIKDFEKQHNSTSAVILYLKNKLINFGKTKTDELFNRINNLDTQKLGNEIKSFIKQNLKDIKGE